MDIGLTIGKHFIGYKGSVSIQPLITDGFTEEREDGRPFLVVANDWRDLLTSLGNDYTDKQLIQYFGSIAEIYAPVNDIAGRAALGKYILRNKKTNEVITDNVNFNTLVASPNPFQNFSQLVYEYICYKKVTGKNFLYANVADTYNRIDYKYVSSLINLPADEITVETDDRIKIFTATKVEDVIKGYTICKGTTEAKTFDTNKVLFTKETNLDWKDKKIKGRSRLLSAKRAIRNIIAVYDARFTVYDKRGQMGMWVSQKTDDSGRVALTAGEKKDMIAANNSLYGVTKNRAPIGVTELPVSFEKSSMSIAEMEPFTETKASALAIYAVLGVPDELMPGNDKATYENKKIAERSLYQNISIPEAVSFCADLTTFLAFDQAGYYVDVDFSHIEVLQENKKEKSELEFTHTKNNKEKFLCGIVTLNNWLSSIGADTNTKNGLYDKFVYDMDEVELALVKQVMELQMRLNPTVDPNAPVNTPA